MKLIIGFVIGVIVAFVFSQQISDFFASQRCLDEGGIWDRVVGCSKEAADLAEEVLTEASVSLTEIELFGEAAELVEVTIPAVGESLNSPVAFVGSAPGYWFFEATVPVALYTNDDVLVGESFITATGDWMTEDLVPFTGTLTYTYGSGPTAGYLFVSRENASDLPENEAYVKIPVVIN